MNAAYRPVCGRRWAITSRHNCGQRTGHACARVIRCGACVRNWASRCVCGMLRRESIIILEIFWFGFDCFYHQAGELINHIIITNKINRTLLLYFEIVINQQNLWMCANYIHMIYVIKTKHKYEKVAFELHISHSIRCTATPQQNVFQLRSATSSAAPLSSTCCAWRRHRRVVAIPRVMNICNFIHGGQLNATETNRNHVNWASKTHLISHAYTHTRSLAHISWLAYVNPYALSRNREQLE